ncbi:GNAT family N-acetyltransferase [Salinicoccus sp. ID82-1]|uniref:GNAT family N-acetyltransferase n=1 Tax=Salinicoccus sp. ID82-1 TaxID=2820269 RepID=UPI001F48A205|nr:GNAT family N-acetyltransferase [Salinicoccus sp. ID82-1]MCG1010764.1 GNAT family N-acetyltransferase [Salinicoccus sp. ID82-1]
MIEISIRDINTDNLARVKRIRIKENQENFIETVDECLAEAEIHKEWCPVSIYAGEGIVGFAMYGAFGKNPDVWIDRIIIDASHQGKGYGTAAMQQLMEIVMDKYSVRTVYLSFTSGNHVAQKIYEKLGFRFTEEYDPAGELIYRYEATAENI